MAKQFRLHRGEVTLFRRPHDYDDGEEPLALPKEEADPIESLLRRHVFPIKFDRNKAPPPGKTPLARTNRRPWGCFLSQAPVRLASKEPSRNGRDHLAMHREIRW